MSRERWTLWERWQQLDQCEFEALDELCHEVEVERVDDVAGKVVVGIAEEGRIGDHERGPACVPERGVIAQARRRQDPPIEGQEQQLYRQVRVVAESLQDGTPEPTRAPVSDDADEVASGGITGLTAKELANEDSRRSCRTSAIQHSVNSHSGECSAAKRGNARRCGSYHRGGGVLSGKRPALFSTLGLPKKT